MLTIAVCLKYVRSELLFEKQLNDFEYSINPYDLFMLEQIIAFKKIVSSRIIGIVMGPKECSEATKRSIAMGIDDLYLISDPCFSGSDTYATSYILSCALQKVGKIDMYAFGEKALDGETGQVPIGVASRLNLSYVTCIKKIIAYSDRCIQLERQFMQKTEGILHPVPVVLCFKGFSTFGAEINLTMLKKAQKYSPIVINANSLQINKQRCGQRGSKTKVISVEKMIPQRRSEILDGTSKEKADMLQILLSKGGSRV